MEDDSIYNAIIASLIIGIIIVIITLIVARPEPETFTELYFNDHKTLPKYVEENKEYEYSFTISNHENRNKEYNYTITKELYNFDYSCEASNLYFEEKQSSIYEMFVKGNYTIPTRTSQPKDPALMIKEDDYSASFNYRIRSGAGQIVIKFQSPAKEKYAIVINEKQEKAYLLEFEEDKIRIRKADIEKTDKQLHSVNIFVHKDNIKLYVDGRIIFDTKIREYASGSFAFETTKTYADITNFVIGKRGIKQNVNIRFDDIEYETINLETKRYIGKDKYALYKSYLKGENSKKTSHFKDYAAEKEINMSSYTLESIFRIIKGEQVSLGLKDSFEIVYNDNEVVIGWETEKGLRVSNKNVKRGQEWHKISIDIDKNKAKIYFDYKLIKEVDDLLIYSGKKPFMRAYDSEISIREFSAKSNIKPYIIRYTIPVESQQDVEYIETLDTALLQLAQNIMFNASSATERELLRELFEIQKTDWENYRITANYIDENRNSTLLLSFNEIDEVLYSLTIDNKNNKVEVNYQKEGLQRITKEGLLIDTLYHKIDIDVSENNLSIKIDNMDVFNEEVDKTSDGVLLLDYPEELRFAKLQIEDKDSNKVKVLRIEEPGCKPIFLKKGSYSKSIFIPNEELKTVNGKMPFNENFDIAKVKISLENDQEIHFWVTKI